MDAENGGMLYSTMEKYAGREDDCGMRGVRKATIERESLKLF